MGVAEVDKKSGRLSIVIPVFNEQSIVVDHVRKILGIINNANIPYELILVDDGSRDATWSKLCSLSEQYPGLKAIRLSRNFGKEAALCAGLDAVSGDACLCMDVDLQHPPELIPRLYEVWANGEAKVVEAVKSNRGSESAFYRFGAQAFYRILHRTAGIDLRDASGFRLLDAEALEAWRSMPERQTFFRGMSSWIGYSRAQIRFDVPQREDGPGKWSSMRLLRLAVDAITSYTAVPLYFSALAGGALLLAFLLLAAQTVFMKLSGQAQDGFTTVILLQLMIGGTLMLVMGIMGLYLKNIYEEVKQRPRYLIESTAVSKEQTVAPDA